MPSGPKKRAAWKKKAEAQLIPSTTYGTCYWLAYPKQRNVIFFCCLIYCVHGFYFLFFWFVAGVTGSCIVKDENMANENETPALSQEVSTVVRTTGRVLKQPSYLQDYHCHLQNKTHPESLDHSNQLSDVLVCDTGNEVLQLVHKEDEKDIESSGVFVNPSDSPQGAELMNAIEPYAGVADNEVALKGSFFKLLEMVEQIECLVQGMKGLITKQKEQM